MSSSNVKLISSDGIEFSVPRSVMALSSTITNLISDQEPVLLKDMTSETLKKVITWCQHHLENPQPPRTSGFELSDWEKEFFKVEKEMLFTLVLVGSQQGIQSLKTAGSKAIAERISGKSPKELRELFGMH